MGLKIRNISFLGVSACVLALSACTALPDTSDYTAASYRLKSSSAAAGEVVSDEFARMVIRLPESSQAVAAREKTRFDEAWTSTVTSMGALATYAESVEELTKAGNNGRESAEGLATSLENLSKTLGFMPGAQVLELGTDTFAFINSQIALVRAARSLERSLAVADPIIADMANVISGQIDRAERQFNTVVAIQREAIGNPVSALLPVYNSLVEQEKSVGADLASLTQQGDNEAERARVEAAHKRLLAGLNALEPRMARYRSELEQLDDRAKAGKALFAVSRASLLEWRAAHIKVARAVEERRPVSVASLSAANEEMKDIV